MHLSHSLAARLRYLVLSLALLLAQSALAETSSNHRPLDPPGTRHQLWVVSTRFASSYPAPEQTGHLKYWRCDPDACWRSSSLPELLGTDDPNVVTLVYVHENRVSRTESFRRAWSVFHQLANVAPPEQRFRLIAISWPSDRIGHRPRPDVKVKAQRSEAHGYYLAWLLDQIHPDVPVAMFGYSFGPRMITAALHYLGGGSIYGQTLYQRVHPQRRPMRAVLMAAALDAHWLYPGQHHGQALTQVQQVLIVANPADRVLRWYPHMDCLLGGGPQALGYVGARCDPCFQQFADLVEDWYVSQQVGSNHSWHVYEGSPRMMAQIAPYLFGPS